MKRKPQIVIVSKHNIDQRIGKFGNKNVNAITVGNRIYITKKANKLDLEHEKAHVALGHRNDKKINAYTYARREVLAEKIAHDKVGGKVSKGYLNEVRKDIKSIWGKHTTDKKELAYRARDAVNKASNKYGIKYRV